ncbi:Uncharacterised protein [Bordetella pertussis]|nr:Uncharacterised protein [Bordetella pertussis]
MTIPVVLCARRRVATEKPSSPGTLASRITISQDCDCKNRYRDGASPHAHTTLNPYPPRPNANSSRKSSSSSSNPIRRSPSATSIGTSTRKPSDRPHWKTIPRSATRYSQIITNFTYIWEDFPEFIS